MTRLQKEAYAAGFVIECRKRGIDPDGLLKVAQVAGWNPIKATNAQGQSIDAHGDTQEEYNKSRATTAALGRQWSPKELAAARASQEPGGANSIDLPAANRFFGVPFEAPITGPYLKSNGRAWDKSVVGPVSAPNSSKQVAPAVARAPVTPTPQAAPANPYVAKTESPEFADEEAYNAAPPEQSSMPAQPSVASQPSVPAPVAAPTEAANPYGDLPKQPPSTSPSRYGSTGISVGGKPWSPGMPTNSRNAAANTIAANMTHANYMSPTAFDPTPARSKRQTGVTKNTPVSQSPSSPFNPTGAGLAQTPSTKYKPT